MVRKSFMLVAGEPSGDILAAELIPQLRQKLAEREGAFTDDRQPLHANLQPEFFGAGGPHLAAAGAELAFDMTQYAVVGFWEVIKRYRQFRRLFNQLLELAIARQPTAIIFVDFSGFNLRLAAAIGQHVRSLRGTFGNWSPRLIQYVSPQVWASRPERAQRLARNADLLLSILPFEKEWYARNARRLPVVFVGHPLIERYTSIGLASGCVQRDAPQPMSPGSRTIVLLPGSRVGELRRHLPVQLAALSRIRTVLPGLRASLVLPNTSLADLARTFQLPPDLEIRSSDLSSALQSADLALAATGTVTLECAYFGVPTVALYMTSPATYWIAQRLIRVKFLAMPNLLAGEEIFPEFIQDAATPENIARAALQLLKDPERCRHIQAKLGEVIKSLGPPGASARAAEAILNLLQAKPPSLRAALR